MKKRLLAAAAVSGMAAGGFAWVTRTPESQFLGRTLLAGTAPEEIALTFDDGPNDRSTYELLDVLAKYAVRATFFLMGDYVRQRPEIARAVAQAGHLLGNHTMTHPSLLWEPPAAVWYELVDCTAVIEDVTGVRVKYFRPPFGTRRPEVFRAAAELGLTPVMWNVTAHDWDARDPQVLAERVQRMVQRNQGWGRSSNVLLHDGGHRNMGVDRAVTVEATRLLLEKWSTGPAQLVTVDAWG